MNGDVIRINGRYVRPDFQVVEIATSEIVAVHEAKTGTTTYLRGNGAAVIARYRQFATKVGYAPPEVIPDFQVRNRPNALMRGMGRVLPFVFILDVLAQAASGGPYMYLPLAGAEAPNS